jgi:hypothetical protein
LQFYNWLQRLLESSLQPDQEVSPVLSKCANPACLARFRYLHEGRIFNIETGTASAESDRSPLHKIEHFWLCERCAQVFELVLENGVVITRPLHLELPEGSAQDKSRRKRDVA